jgi:tetratricopeptide (TPR) repeat protein
MGLASRRRSHVRHSDSLWPVLVLTTCVLSSGGAIEAYARSRETGAVQIVVAREAATTGTSAETADDSDETEDDPDTSAPVSEEHGLARNLARRGEIPRALELLRKVVGDNPAALGPKLDLGYWLRQGGRLTESKAALEQARDAAPDSMGALRQLAATQRAAGDTDAAEINYREALELKPNHGRTLLALASLLKQGGRANEALELLERAASAGSNADRAEANLALGKARLSSGHVEAALAAFRSAIDFSPSDVSVRLSIAKACLASGQRRLYIEARAQAERAALLAPDRALVVGLLGWVRERSGDRDGARSAYQLALQIDPDLDYAERKLLHLDLAAQDLRSARRHAEHLVARLPDEAEHHFLLALVVSREGKLDDARTHYLVALDKAHGQYPEAHFNLGRLEKAAGKLEASIASYRKALEQKPNYPEALNNLGIVLRATGQSAEARNAWKEALRLDEHYAPAWVNLGELAATERSLPEAEAAFVRALELKPKLASALLGLARAKRDANRLADAVVSYRRLVAQQPKNARAWFELAELLERQADLRGAADAALNASQLAPEDADFLFKRADMLGKLGELQAARAALDELIDGSPNHERARLALAELLHRMGDNAGCQREAQRVVASAGAQARARSLIALCAKS